jgi:hypothetical protein
VEPVVTYRGGIYFLGHTLLAALSAFIAFLLAWAGAVPVIPVAFFAFAVACVASVKNDCRRIELRTDGTLEVCFFVQPRVTAYVEDVHRIDLKNDEPPSERASDRRWYWKRRALMRRARRHDLRYTLRLADRTKLQISATPSGRLLVHELVRRNPNIELRGQGLPAL